MTPELAGRISRCEWALSLTQPWAWLVVSRPGDHWKNIENRKKGFSHKSFRGDFFVHAAKKCTRQDYADCIDWCSARFGFDFHKEVPGRLSLEKGCIIGIANIYDVVPPTSTPDDPPSWHMEDQYGFLLRDRAEVPFVGCLGMLGFWRVRPGIKESLEFCVRQEPLT